MSDQDPFDKNEEPKEIPDKGESSTDPYVDRLMEIVDDEGKPKYKNTEEALKALAHSQQHIKTLEADNAASKAEIERSREELAKRETAEEIIKRLTENKSNPEVKTNTDAKTLDENKVMELVRQTLEQESSQKIAAKNREDVLKQLASKYGDEDAVRKAVSSRASELGITPKELGAMSEKNPKMVLELFGQKHKPTNTTSSSVNIPINVDKDDGKLTIEKSLTRGGVSDKGVLDVFARSKALTNKRLGIE